MRFRKDRSSDEDFSSLVNSSTNISLATDSDQQTLQGNEKSGQSKGSVEQANLEDSFDESVNQPDNGQESESNAKRKNRHIKDANGLCDNKKNPNNKLHMPR